MAQGARGWLCLQGYRFAMACFQSAGCDTRAQLMWGHFSPHGMHMQCIAGCNQLQPRSQHERVDSLSWRQERTAAPAVAAGGVAEVGNITAGRGGLRSGQPTTARP